MARRSKSASVLVPLTGVVFVVSTVVGLALGGEPPDADAPAAEVVDYWTDNDTAVLVGTVLEALAAVALVFFAAAVLRAVRREEDGDGVLSAVAFGGGLVAAAGIGVDAALRFALADLADDVDPAITQTLSALWSDFFFPMVIGIATLIGALGLAALRTHVVPSWLAWVGFAICIAFFTPAGFVAFLVSGVWVIVASILLWRHEAALDAQPTV